MAHNSEHRVEEKTAQMIVGIGDDVLRRIEKWCGPKRFVQPCDPAVAVLEHIHVESGVVETTRDLINSKEQGDPHQEQGYYGNRLALPSSSWTGG
jgi:hypothetical protein